MRGILSYIELHADHWDRVRRLAQSSSEHTVHGSQDSKRVLIIRDKDDSIILDLGRNEENDYHWAIFSILDEGCEMIREAFQLVEDQHIH